MSDASKTFVTPFPGMVAEALINRYIRLHNLNAPATMSDDQKPFAGIDSGHIVNQLTTLEVKKEVKEEGKEEGKEKVKEPVANGLEILPFKFIKEGWVICPGCLGEIDSGNNRYIIRITECGHIMHQSCFKKWKEYFLSKNHDKTCCPCPQCRGKCCY